MCDSTEPIFQYFKLGKQFYPYHLEKNSIYRKSTIEMIDHRTVKNRPDGYPLANNDQTCFLSANEVRKALLNAYYMWSIEKKLHRVTIIR